MEVKAERRQEQQEEEKEVGGREVCRNTEENRLESKTGVIIFRSSFYLCIYLLSTSYLLRCILRVSV